LPPLFSFFTPTSHYFSLLFSASRLHDCFEDCHDRVSFSLTPPLFRFLIFRFFIFRHVR